MILVVAADFAGVGQAAELDPHPRRIAIGDGLVLTGRVVERGKRVFEWHRRGPVPGTLARLNGKTRNARVKFQAGTFLFSIHGSITRPTWSKPRRYSESSQASSGMSRGNPRRKIRLQVRVQNSAIRHPL